MATLPKKYVPEGSDPTIEKFINCMMRDGKKSTARRIFWDAMETIKTRTKDSPLEVFNKALLNVTPLVEVRPKRVGGSVYQVPVEVNPKRQQTLAVRWLIGAGHAAAASHDTALDILRERFARGEIDQDEYNERKRHLTQR